ncbi:hypothetical protein SEA_HUHTAENERSON15_83 [Mycobacterium phage HuhtaEnerson15]|nr:hypothetical protein SEA_HUHTAENERSON15_83 [Mycobacterium phage HuhtaEnerson15]
MAIQFRTQEIYAGDLEEGDSFLYRDQYVCTIEGIEDRGDKSLLLRVVSTTFGGMDLRFDVILRNWDVVTVVIAQVGGCGSATHPEFQKLVDQLRKLAGKAKGVAKREHDKESLWGEGYFQGKEAAFSLAAQWIEELI